MLVIQLHSSHFSSRLFVLCTVRAEQAATKTYNSWSQSRIECMSSMLRISRCHIHGTHQYRTFRWAPAPAGAEELLLLGHLLQVAFVSNTEMLSVEPSIHDLTLLPAPGGTASYRITRFMLLGLSGTFITSFFKNKCLYSCLAC